MKTSANLRPPTSKLFFSRPKGDVQNIERTYFRAPDLGAKESHRLFGGFQLSADQVSLIAKVFEAYATGNYRGQRTFLRFSDLKEFAEDVAFGTCSGAGSAGLSELQEFLFAF